MAEPPPHPRPLGRLAGSTSPYLRQHADNPVDWYPWGPEALERAARVQRPILLSVGYSACHWCHVMAHESFEDETTAADMNAWFVNIKVDREERPDIDAIYQKVVALMGEGGGWPLTVFLTPDQRPFYGGTYFPDRARFGRPAFRDLLAALHRAWIERRDELEAQADRFMQGFSELAAIVDEELAGGATGIPLEDPRSRRAAAQVLASRVDPRRGGFGRAPKFPAAPALECLAALARREGGAAETALRLTLRHMAHGGIYDHLRGGFCRYAVDGEWLVPHFEKMLYDNALLVGLYADASVCWPEDEHARRVVTETVEYLVADMRASDGTFFSATDADSEGEEGRYFTWTPDELRDVLGDPDVADRFAAAYGVTAGGNFEHGRSILHLAQSIAAVAEQLGTSVDALRDELARARARLLVHRYGRVPPLRDEKVITEWNALLVSGLCRAAVAAQAWGDPGRAQAWTELATVTCGALVGRHVAADGRVYRASFRGVAHTRGYLEDVGALARACLDLHALVGDVDWLRTAVALAEHAMTHHARPGGGFFLGAHDAEPLIERTESQHDGPVPSGLAHLVEALARLELAEQASEPARAHLRATLARFSGAAREPFAYAGLLGAAAFAGPDVVSVRLSGAAEGRAVLAAVAARARLSGAPLVVWHEPGTDTPANAVVCRGQACGLPISDPAELRAALA
jgi:hypothetical protein